MDTTDAPGTGEGQVTVTTEAPNTPGEGQGTTVADTGAKTEPAFEERLSEFYAKKGWDAETGHQKLLESYEQLESKLGNWSEVEQKAKEYESVMGQYPTLREKAEAWDRAQENLVKIERESQLGADDIDMSRASTEMLARLWQSGQVGLADIPADRQYEVQKFVQAQDTANDAMVATHARQLTEAHPILRDEKYNGVIVDAIERGGIAGKKMSPEQIIKHFEELSHYSEKKGEERIQKDTERLKQGNLERSGVAVNTKPNRTIRSVRDAFNAAKEDTGLSL